MGAIQWDEVRMMRKLSDGALSWNLVASPDDEFRVFKKGAPPNTDPFVVRGTDVNVYN